MKACNDIDLEYCIKCVKFNWEPDYTSALNFFSCRMPLNAASAAKTTKDFKYIETCAKKMKGIIARIEGV